MSKFKVGDDVLVKSKVVIGPGSCDLESGKIYKIEGSKYYLKDYKDFRHSSCPHSEQNLRLRSKQTVNSIEHAIDKAIADLT